jgi:hypothetical protein
MSTGPTPYADQPVSSDKLGLDDYAALRGIDAALRLIADAVDGEEYERKARSSLRHRYSVRDGATWKSIVTKQGVPMDIRLTTFIARITGETIECDGDEQTRYYEIEGTANGRTVTFTILASEFRSLSWIARHLGGAAVILPPTEDREVAAAIQLLSPEDRAVRRRHTHTGWIRHQGADVYLDGAGAIGADGRIEGIDVALPPQFEHYGLEEPTSPEDLVTAVRASLAVTEVTPLQYSVPVLGTAYQAPVEQAPDSLFVHGLTGSFKTCMTALTLQHFGRRLDYQHPTESFASTSNALREVAHKGKDISISVDDYSPPPDPHRAAEMAEKANGVFRGAANRAGRSRAARDGSLRPGHRPRATIISSGTQLPPADDVQARLTVLYLHRDLVDRQALTRSQQDAAKGLFAQAMFGFIQWLARDRQGHLDYYHRRVGELTGEFQSASAHPRTAPAMAARMAALEIFIEYAGEAGALNDQQAVDWQVRFKGALLDASDAQAPDRSLTEPAERFVHLFRDALAAGRCHIVTSSGAMPLIELAPICGWKQVQNNDGNGTGVPGGPLVGWLEGQEEEVWERLNLYLNPSESLAAVQRLATDMKQPFIIGERDLRYRLKEAGYLIFDQQAKNEKNSRNTLTIRKTRWGGRQSVLHLNAKRVLGLDDGGDQQTPAPEAQRNRNPKEGNAS